MTTHRDSHPLMRGGSLGSGTVSTHWDVCRLAVAVSVALRDYSPVVTGGGDASAELETQSAFASAQATGLPRQWFE